MIMNMMITFKTIDKHDLYPHHHCHYHHQHHDHHRNRLHKELCVDSGEQLCVLLGFRTTDDNCVDTLEADSERSQVSVVMSSKSVMQDSW